MASGRTKFIAAAAIVVAGAGGYLLYSVLAAQAQGDLAQAPLNVQTQATPAFVMAVDNSGSMTFHNQFPASDGYACWDSDSFFSSGGVLRTSGTCSFSYSYTGPRISTGYYGIPPFDSFGFSRSPDFNPAYFNPEITYLPWLDADGTPYNGSANASTTATRIDPRQTGTINLASDLPDANGRSLFRLMTNMVLPAGAQVRMRNDNNNNNNNANGYSCGGLTNPNNSNWVTVGGGGHTMTGDCNAYIQYWPATFYLRETVANTAPAITAPGYGSITPVRILNACGTGCHLWRYTITTAHPVALQNFANWYSFYGNRNRAMVAGMTRAMTTVRNLRVGYFQINDHSNFDDPVGTVSERVAMRDLSNDTERASLYTSMLALNASGSTPNRQAVNAAGQQFKRTDSGAPVKLQCQKNAVMLFTDGYSNQGTPSSTNVDGAMGAPFQDSHSGTMADIATSFYLDDAGGNSPIRPAMTPAGIVPIPDACWLNKAAGILDPAADKKLDCQPNLHVNFYGVTLNGRGALFNPDQVQDPYTDSAIYNNWPAAQDNNNSTVDDIWHAAVNTRGKFVNARTPADITLALRQILQAVSTGGSSSGSLAMTGSRIGTRSLSVVPSYAVRNEGTDWSSTLAVAKVTADLATANVTDTPLWEGASKLASLSTATRRAHTWVGTSSGTSLLNTVSNLTDFCNNPRPGMSRCTAAEITALGVNASQSIDYFLGDTTREVRNSGTLRDRTTVLGDIINSTPVVSAPTDDYGYRMLGTHGGVNYGSTYDTYMTTKQSRPAMVYVGANDGMLHAFHGGINYQGTVDAANAGREQFAYIPRAVLGHMGNLLFPYNPVTVGQKFDHRYYVDGPITAGDYYSGGWKTALVGTAGAGGRSVFALNVSNPSSFNRLWEIDDQHATAAVASNIGHVLGKPVIVPFRTAAGAVSWKVIFGNGYNSADGKAVLFVVNIDDGTVRMIEAVEAGAPAGSNGLGNITVVDRRDPVSGFAIRDGFADTVYAADQKGAVWKFDLLNAATSISAPLFTTQAHVEGGVTYRQPIIGGLTATAGGTGGVMLLFGTGSFSFNGDAGDSSIQSIYGVQDVGGTVTLTSANLFGRTILVDGASTRTITSGSMGYGSSGWYLNLPAGERVVGYPRVASGVLFIPAYAPTAADGCSTGGENWLYGLNTRTGAPELASVRFGSITGATQGAGVGAIIMPTTGSAPIKDVGVSVLSTSKPIDPSVPRCWMRVVAPGMTQAMLVPYPCGRQSWRQLK